MGCSGRPAIAVEGVGKLIMYEGRLVGSFSELLRRHPEAAAEGTLGLQRSCNV
jgi:hypothetical protein